ncbi:MAG: hypothetical protein JO046_00425 [Solirubrobacterales bacterium]|nr:hypothetical protein [Solirubrobacterales bacterium]
MKTHPSDAVARQRASGPVLACAALGLRGRVTPTGWEPPEGLGFEEWREAGEALGRLERSVAWWIGDWWAFGEHRYGSRKALVESEDWDGPSLQTCANAAAVCRAFETSRRREALTFRHHAEVAGLALDEADRLLDWAEAPLAATGRPLSTRELRAQASRLARGRGLAPSGEGCTTADLESLAASGRKFGCVYADPPWPYDNQGTRAATGAHYGGMGLDELCALPVRELAAADAHLHLWTTNGFLFEAPKIFDAWGFAFRSALVWVKPALGLGNYWRNSHELLLTAVRGEATRFNDATLRSWFECARAEHSAKPEPVRGMLERASPGPYLELFGRRPAAGWTVWGEQVERGRLAPAAAG